MRQPVPDRECGDCSECCTVHGMPGGSQPCRYLAKGAKAGGCSIYERRPTTCQTFFCEWRYGLGTDADRPDRLGVVPHDGGPYGKGSIRLAVSPGGITAAARVFADHLALDGLRVVWVKLRATNTDGEPSTPVSVERAQVPEPVDR